ncbi:hypothetical protein BDZ89DRAFT_1004331 [Hymenopellis radicata]|nr:hypothetical protein BDZ89DRAFT_1004331 [Hymenopellis radicata]
MAFKPRYAQPFSLSDAISLDLPVITEEIARLQHSLQKLRETQDVLREYIEESKEHDPEIMKAVKENEVVIGSQEERIEMLKIALRDKGVSYHEHYNLSSATSQPNSTTAPHSAPQTIEPEADEEGGIHL